MIAPFEVQYVCREVERELAEAETGGTFVKQVSLRAVNRPSPPIADTRLSGMRLIIARSVWIVLMLLSCGLYLAAVLVYYVQLHGFQEGVYAHLISTPAVVSGYDAFEFSSALLTGPYATLNFTLVTLVLPPFWIAVSLVIFWRRSDDWMALFVALFLVMLVTIFSPALSALSYVIGYTSPLGICITLLQLLAMSSFGFFIALFPDGRFVPGWTRWLTLTYLLVLVFLCLPSTSPYSMVRWPPVLLGPLLLGLAFAWGFAQLYRYRRVSTTIQRQQTKWIVFGMLVAMLWDVSNVLLPLALPRPARHRPGRRALSTTAPAAATSRQPPDVWGARRALPRALSPGQPPGSDAGHRGGRAHHCADGCPGAETPLCRHHLQAPGRRHPCGLHRRGPRAGGTCARAARGSDRAGGRPCACSTGTWRVLDACRSATLA